MEMKNRFFSQFLTLFICLSATSFAVASDIPDKHIELEKWKSKFLKSDHPKVLEDMLLHHPDKCVLFENYLIFAGSEPIQGSELWITDGTAQGTKTLKDINPGEKGSEPNFFLKLNKKIYFTAISRSDSPHAFLWETNGTTNGTKIVKSDVFARNLKSMNGKIYFSGCLEPCTDGFELWKSDGTSAGTVLVKDIFSGGTGSDIGTIFPIGNQIYFDAKSSSGVELWKSDGTANGTVMVKDIRSGSSGSFPKSFAEFNNMLYFTADDGINGYELWKSNGTSAGTVMVKDLAPGARASSPGAFTKVGNNLIFADSTGVWKTDGTAANTIKILDLGDRFQISKFVLFGNNAYFIRFHELWKTNGINTAGTTRVKAFNNLYPFDCPVSLTLFDNKLYFIAERPDDRNRFRALWKSDGTEAGTVEINSPNFTGSEYGHEEIIVWPSNNTLFPGSLVILKGIDGKLYRYNPTSNAEGVTLVVEIGNVSEGRYGKINGGIVYEK